MFIIVVALCVVAMVLGLDYEKHEILIGYFFYIFYDKSFMVIIFGYILIFKEFFSTSWIWLYTCIIKREKQNKILNYLILSSSSFDFGIFKIIF